MLFATKLIGFPAPVGEIHPHHRIPDEAITPEVREWLLKNDLAVEAEPEKPAAPPAPPPKPHLSDWAFDPKTLEKDTLETLNMKIANHVQKHGLVAVEPFESIDEAKFWMSKDL